MSVALETSEKLGFYSMSYDFVFDSRGEPKICEISYTFQVAGRTGLPGLVEQRS